MLGGLSDERWIRSWRRLDSVAFSTGHPHRLTEELGTLSATCHLRQVLLAERPPDETRPVVVSMMIRRSERARRWAEVDRPSGQALALDLVDLA
jgi:hypothetical protein